MRYVIFFGLVLIPLLLNAVTIYVPADYPTIQGAIDAASHNDIVIVDPGTYHEQIDFLGKNIIVASRFYTEQDTSFISSTIIDGNQEVYSVVTFNNGETLNAKLIGFTITGGNADAEMGSHHESDGGGIYIDNFSNPTISDCIITANYATARGGGIFINMTNPRIFNCHISNNSAGSGGGIYVFVLIYQNMLIENITLEGNSATGLGGGMFIIGTDASFTLKNSTIKHNSASHSGGGISVFAALTVNVTNCLFHSNYAEFAGAIFIQSTPYNENTYTYITNTTISNNSAGIDGGSIYLKRKAKALILNSVSYNNHPSEIVFSADEDANSLSVAYSNIEGGENGITTNNNGDLEWLDGNINNDPMFVHPELGDYTLSEGSPCIDAGINYFFFNNSIIINLIESEYYGDAPDMGAFQYGAVSTGYYNLPSVPKNRIDVYPNPFNPETTIKLNLARSGSAKMGIYNTKGQNLITLTDKFLSQGEHLYHWNGRNNRNEPLPSGIYIVKLNQNEETISSKVTLLK